MDPYRPPRAPTPEQRAPLPWLRIALAYGIPGSCIGLGGAALWELDDLCNFDSTPTTLSFWAFWALTIVSSFAAPLGIYAAVGRALWHHVLGRMLLGASSVVLASTMAHLAGELIEAALRGEPLGAAAANGLATGAVLGCFICVVGLIPALLIRPPEPS